MKNFKRNVDGITLIALVVTIIVLLILAGISINMLIGKNGIIRSAGQASETTKDVSEDEQLKLAVADALIYGTGTLTTDNVRQGLISEFGENKVTDTTFTGTGPWTFKGERKTYTIEKNGKITSEGTPISPTEEKLAKKVLLINPDASTDYGKSPYVTYNNILCRVFYNDTDHGLQIISADNEGNVTLGSDSDFNEAKNDYNDLVNILNNKAKDYMSEADKADVTDENKIAIDARSLGSIAKLQGGKFQGDSVTEMEFESSYNYFTGYNRQFKVADNNYEDDALETTGQLKKLGLNATSRTWLASRETSSSEYSTWFIHRSVLPDNSYDYRGGYFLSFLYNGVGPKGGPKDYRKPSAGFRPVFLLSSDVKIKSGDGTKNAPYELEI